MRPDRIYFIMLGILFLTIALFAMSHRPSENAVAESRAGVITRLELDMAVDRYIKQLGRLTPEKVYSETERADLRRTTLDDFILRRILVKMADKDPTIQVLPSDVRERYLIVCSGIFNNSEAEFAKALTDDGWTEQEYLDNLREIIIAEEMRRKYIGELPVTARQGEAYYRAHLTDFNVEEITLSHILVALPERDAPDRGLKTVRTELLEKGVSPESLEVKVQAEEARRLEKINLLLDSARAGIPFAELAKRHSDDGSNADGGRLGVVTKGMMVKSFEDAGFALKKGELSGVVKTEFGYHIIRADSDPANRTQKLDEVRMQIEGRLRAEEENRRLEKLMKKWKVKRYLGS